MHTSDEAVGRQQCATRATSCWKFNLPRGTDLGQRCSGGFENPSVRSWRSWRALRPAVFNCQSTTPGTNHDHVRAVGDGGRGAEAQLIQARLLQFTGSPSSAWMAPPDSRILREMQGASNLEIPLDVNQLQEICCGEFIGMLSGRSMCVSCLGDDMQDERAGRNSAGAPWQRECTHRHSVISASAHVLSQVHSCSVPRFRSSSSMNNPGDWPPTVRGVCCVHGLGGNDYV